MNVSETLATLEELKQYREEEKKHRDIELTRFQNRFRAAQGMDYLPVQSMLTEGEPPLPVTSVETLYSYTEADLRRIFFFYTAIPSTRLLKRELVDYIDDFSHTDAGTPRRNPRRRD